MEELEEEFFTDMADKDYLYDLPDDIAKIPTIEGIDKYEQYQEEFDEVDQGNYVDFKQRQQMTFVKEGEALGGFEAGRRAFTSIREKQLIIAKEILFGSTFKKVEDKNKVINKYSSISDIDHLNMGLLVSATVFSVENKKLTKESLEGFEKKYKTGELNVDLVRYIQFAYREIK